MVVAEEHDVRKLARHSLSRESRFTLVNKSFHVTVNHRRELPQEMIDHVIDYLCDNRSALKVASQISRAWVPRSRHHLFRALRLTSANAKTTFAILGHPFCTFLSIVQVLFLEVSFMSEEGSSEELVQPILPIIKKMTLVRSLEISNLNHIQVWNRLLECKEFMAGINHLVLRDIFFDTFEQWMKFIHAFPSLVSFRHFIPQKLENYVDNLWPSLGLPDISYAPPSSLRTLEIISLSSCGPLQHPWSQLMWKWLYRTGTRLSEIRFRGLISISVNDIELEGLRPFSDYILFLGPFLEVLNLDFKDKYSIFRFFANVDLSKNSGIRVLELGNICLFSNSETGSLSLTHHFLTIPKLLSKLPSGTPMKKIVFELVVTPFDEDSVDFLNAADQEDTDAAWGTIDSMLAGESFPSLAEVFAFVRPDASATIGLSENLVESLGLVNYIGRKMPKCSEKGYLRVESRN